MGAQKSEALLNFVARLRAAMKRRDVTLYEVGRACGVAVSTVGAWTQGKNWPTVELQPPLAAFLGMNVNFLIHGIVDGPQGSGAQGDQFVGPGADLHRYLADLVRAADGNRDRLGWIAEQLREHLSAPKSWGVVVAPASAHAAPASAAETVPAVSVLPHGALPSHTQALSTETGQPLPEAVAPRKVRRGRKLA